MPHVQSIREPSNIHVLLSSIRVRPWPERPDTFVSYLSVVPCHRGKEAVESLSLTTGYISLSIGFLWPPHSLLQWIHQLFLLILPYVPSVIVDATPNSSQGIGREIKLLIDLPLPSLSLWKWITPSFHELFPCRVYGPTHLFTLGDV